MFINFKRHNEVNRTQIIIYDSDFTEIIYASGFYIIGLIEFYKSKNLNYGKNAVLFLIHLSKKSGLSVAEELQEHLNDGCDELLQYLPEINKYLILI